MLFQPWNIQPQEITPQNQTPQHQAPQYAPKSNSLYSKPTYAKPQQTPSYNSVRPLLQNPDVISRVQSGPLNTPPTKKPKGKLIIEEITFDDESDSSSNEEDINCNKVPVVEAPVKKVCSLTHLYANSLTPLLYCISL